METQVLIAGAGIAGLATAIELQRLGISHQIIEKDTQIRPQIKGEFFQPVAIPHLKNLRVYDRLINKGAVRIDEVSHVYTTIGFGRWRRYQSNYSEFEKGAHGLSILHEDILQCFRDEYEAIGGSITLGVSVQDIKIRDGSVEVHCSNGQKVLAKYFLGADGKFGISRKKAGLSVHEGRTKQVMLAGLVSGLKIPKNEFYTEETRDGVLYAFWSNHKLVRVYLCVGRSKYENEKNNLKQYFKNQLLASQIRGRWKSKLEGPVAIMPTLDRMLTQNHVGGCLWIGDSAGTVDPLCGHGMALALEQAKRFSEAVSLQLNSEEFKVLAERMHEDYLHTRHLGLWIGRIFMQNALINKVAKHRAIRSYEKDPELKRFLLGLFSGLIKEPYAIYDLPYLLGLLPTVYRNRINAHPLVEKIEGVQNQILVTPFGMMKDKLKESTKQFLQFR